MHDYPSPAERRITIRLLAYWEKMRGERPMPTEQDINPEDIRDLWDNCFLVHVKDLSKSDYNYTYLGQGIIEAYHYGLGNNDDAVNLLSPNAGQLAHGYAQVVKTRRPLVEDGEFQNLHNETVKYRQCLLPLGEEDQVDAIFGGMRFKIFTSS